MGVKSRCDCLGAVSLLLKGLLQGEFADLKSQISDFKSHIRISNLSHFSIFHLTRTLRTIYSPPLNLGPVSAEIEWYLGVSRVKQRTKHPRNTSRLRARLVKLRGRVGVQLHDWTFAQSLSRHESRRFWRFSGVIRSFKQKECSKAPESLLRGFFVMDFFVRPNRLVGKE